MKRCARHSAICFVLALYLLCILVVNCPVRAEETGEVPSPTLAPGAVAYDSAHPENLLQEQLAAQAFILMEASTGDILMQYNADEMMNPASTTKIMTALLALEYARNAFDDIDEGLAQVITASESVTQLADDGSMIGLRDGERITLKDALYGMMLHSGNDAAVAVAEFIGGSEAAFIDQMNQAAALLGMTDTHFSNPHGLYAPDHYTTARDLALATRTALNNPMFKKIVSTLRYTIPQSNVRASYNMQNSNAMINPDSPYYMSDVIGVKTGTMSQSAYCFVAAAQRKGVTLISVVLYSGMYYRWWDTRKLLEYGFSQYDSVTPEEIYAKAPIDVRTIGFSIDDPNRGELTLDVRAQNPLSDVRITGPIADVQLYSEQYRSYTTIQITSDLRAPIKKGDVLGMLTFYTPDGDAPRYDLIASRDVGARESAPLTIEQIAEMARVGEFIMISWEWLAPPAAIAVAALFALRALFKRIRAKRRDARQIPKPKRRTYQ
ncbi:MAG: D-alanyl-D-alanine carboxypeptidase [Oscillospiraceae bacterium]|nr:D-alanyl-D-alanine carboxypeptidase [Oscillospiraceae bacterium]